MFLFGSSTVVTHKLCHSGAARSCSLTRSHFSLTKSLAKSVTELSKWSERGDWKTRSHHDAALSIQTPTFAERHTFFWYFQCFPLSLEFEKSRHVFQNVSELVSPRKRLLWRSPRKHSPVSLGVVVSNSRIITPPMALHRSFWKVSRPLCLLRVCFLKSSGSN